MLQNTNTKKLPFKFDDENKVFLVQELQCNQYNKMCIVQELSHSQVGIIPKKYVMKKVKTLQEASTEYTIGKTVNHHLLLGTLGIDTVNLVLCMPYFESCDLFDALCGSRLLDKKYIWEQILEGISYLHNDLGVAHCDIKSENILVNDQNEIKIIDFATVQNCDARTKAVLGTPSHWSPEQCMGYFWTPKKVDVWCLGLLLFEICTEKILWERAHSTDMRYNLFCQDGLSPLIEIDHLFLDTTIIEILEGCLCLENFRQDLVFLKEQTWSIVL